MPVSGLYGCTCEHPREEHTEGLGCRVWFGTKGPRKGYCDCWAGSGYMRAMEEKEQESSTPSDPGVIAAPVYEERWEYSGFGKKRLVQTVTGPWIAESEDV